MITAIFTTDKTTLTIETSEAVNLDQMGQQTPIAKLTPGKRDVVVPAGVFRLESKDTVIVTTRGQNVHVAYTTNDKDGQFPDPPAPSGVSLHGYFINGKSDTI
jgi:hypothetical protein